MDFPRVLRGEPSNERRPVQRLSLHRPALRHAGKRALQGIGSGTVEPNASPSGAERSGATVGVEAVVGQS